MSILLDKIANHICRITINNPAKRNALNLNAINDFKAVLTKFEHDCDLHVAIITGSGGNFCAGYDLNEIIDHQNSVVRLEHLQKMLWPLGTRLSKKITIAAIDGHAAGFGYELALKCDYRVADKDARMGFMNRRFGIPIMNGGTVILPKLIGLARSSEIIATGKAQLALEALQYGSITYISDIGCALGRSTNLARCLVKFQQPALLNDLDTLYQSNYLGSHELLVQERLRALEYLRNCGPLENIAKFVRGELGRHGSFDMGNLSKPEPDVTL